MIVKGELKKVRGGFDYRTIKEKESSTRGKKIFEHEKDAAFLNMS